MQLHCVLHRLWKRGYDADHSLQLDDCCVVCHAVLACVIRVLKALSQSSLVLVQVPRSEMQAALALRFGGDGIVKMKGLPFKATADDVIK